MLSRTRGDIRKSDRNVRSAGWVSARLLLKDDNMGLSFHVTTMFAGQELTMHYQNHLEAVLVLKGTGTIEDLATGEIHQLRPGVMYALNDHDRHIVRPETRSEEQTSEPQSQIRISYAILCLKKTQQ